LEHPDRIDNRASILKACNSVYFDKGRNLCGSNTDRTGIEMSLRAAGFERQSVDGDATAAVISYWLALYASRPQSVSFDSKLDR
jgi:shikimate 5-dehydrogenase